MANKKNTINIKIGASSKQFTSEIKKVQRTLRKQGRKLKRLGTSMSKSLTLPLVGVGLAATKTTAEFEQAMAKVKAISGATGKQFEMLNQNALDLGRTTRYTASQVASLQLNLSKLGFDPTEIKAATASILDLALATGEDLSDSATTVAATIKGFNLTAQDSGHVADVMAKSFSSSALDLHKFSTAMAVVAPVANKANVSLEEAAAILGTLTDRGVDAGTSGVSLRNIYLDLAENGLSWADAMKQLKSSSDPLALSMELFGKRGATVATIIADNIDEIDKMTQSLANSDGAATAMAKIMDNTLNGALLRMKSAIEGVAIDIGTALTPMIKRLTERIIKLSDWFVNLSDGSKRLIGMVAGLLTVAGPLLLLLGQMKIAAAALTPVIMSLGGSMTFMLGPVGLVIAGLTALGVVIYKIVKANQKYSAVSKDVISNIHAERTGMNAMFTVLKTTTEGTDARKRAIDELNTRYGDYLPNQLSEKDNLEDIETAQKAANAQLLQSIVLKSKATDIEKQGALAIEKTREEMENLREESEKLKTQGSGFTSKVSEEQAKAFEVGVASILSQPWDTSNTEAYKSSLESIRFEVENLKGELGVGGGSYRNMDNAILGLFNVGVDHHNNMIEINTEYKKMAKLLGVNINQVKKLSDGKETTIETGGYKPGGKEDEERKLAEQRLKWEDQLERMRIENNFKGTERLLKIADLESKIRKRGYAEVVDDATRKKLIKQEEVRLDQQLTQILLDNNAKLKEESFDQEMADLEKLYDEKETKALQNAKTEEGYDAESLKNTRAYLADKLEIYERYGENVSAIQLAIAQLDYDTTTGMTENLTDAEQRMKDTMASISSLIQSFVTDQVIGLIDAIGQELNGSTQAIDRWADNILKSFGEFISKLGAMMMAYGTAKLVIGKGAPGPAMIAAGAVMVGLGGAIKQHIKRKEEKALEANGGGGLDGGYSSQLNSSNNYGSGQNVVVLETVVYGNDILLSSNRQHNTVERTRRK